VSSEPYPLVNEPEDRLCKICKRKLHVQKTRKKTEITLSGKTVTTLVSYYCPDHPEEIIRPSNPLTPKRSIYGYDVIAETGRLRFIENKQIREIHDYFMDRGLNIPTRTIHWLCDRFLHYLMAVHCENMPKINELIKKNGGYVLHIDSSGRRGPMILLLRDGWSGIRILAAPIKSEGSEYVIPHLKTIKKHLGDPVAAIRDMSKGFKTALTKIFPNAYIITCHYHFLKNIAKTLFEPFYPRFRNRIDRLGIKKRLRDFRKVLVRRNGKDEEDNVTLRLIEHILSYDKDGEGLAYPFSLPAVYFYRRCLESADRARQMILARAKRNEFSPLLGILEDILKRLQPPPAVLGRLRTDFDDLQIRWKWFQRVRVALRYRNGPIPLSTEIKLSDKELEKGRSKLDRLINEIDESLDQGGSDHHARKLRRSLRKVSKMMKDNREELLAPNVMVEANGKETIKKLPRTNQPDEIDFRMARRHVRRIRGNSDVEQQFQRDGPGLLMVHNLQDREYVRMVFGTLGQMAARYSKVTSESLLAVKPFMCNSRPIQ